MEPPPQRAQIHVDLNVLLAEIGRRRSAAVRGDAVARVWVAGLDHWLGQYRANAVAPELVITPDLVPVFTYPDAVVDFEDGYRCAAAVQAAGSPS